MKRCLFFAFCHICSYRRIFICACACVCILPLATTSIRGEVLVYDSPFSVEKAKYRTEKVLERLKLSKTKKNKEPQGFEFAIKSKPPSFFRYKLFIGSWKSKNRVLIRLEGRVGNEGQLYTLAQILERENIIKSGTVLSDEQYQNQKELKKKYIAGVLFINLISPTFSAVYEASDSPLLSNRDLTVRGLALFGVELGLFYLAGSNFLQEGFSYTRNQHLVNNTLLLYRLSYLGYAIRSIVAHNRLLKLGYEFSY